MEEILDNIIYLTNLQEVNTVMSKLIEQKRMLQERQRLINKLNSYN